MERSAYHFGGCVKYLLFSWKGKKKEEKGRRMMMLMMRVRRRENEISRVVCQIFML
jgi:hypothetical protein